MIIFENIKNIGKTTKPQKNRAESINKYSFVIEVAVVTH